MGNWGVKNFNLDGLDECDGLTVPLGHRNPISRSIELHTERIEGSNHFSPLHFKNEIMLKIFYVMRTSREMYDLGYQFFEGFDSSETQAIVIYHHELYRPSIKMILPSPMYGDPNDFNISFSIYCHARVQQHRTVIRSHVFEIAFTDALDDLMRVSGILSLLYREKLKKY